MKIRYCRAGAFIVLGTLIAIATASAAPRITRVQDVPDSADTPYENILVVALFSQFDSRRRLEKAIVEDLAKRGTRAVASTSKMNTKTPMTRETYIAMLDELESDALLVTQLVDLESKADLTASASPEATYKVRPTYYFNVWEVSLKEYKEPPSIEVKSSFELATQLYSVASRDAVWAIESKSKIVQKGGPEQNYLVYIEEGEAIVKHMWRAGLLQK